MEQNSETLNFINKCRLIFLDSLYDYSKVQYIKDTIKVTIICTKHGEFVRRPENLIQGCGCKLCYADSNGKKDFVRKANIKHNNKYDYSKLVYVNCQNYVTIICSIHGEFKQLAGSHLAGSGCKLCANNAIRNRQLSDTETFINKAKLIHIDSNYDYSEVKYTGNINKITILCSKHGEFQQAPSSHLSGRGCKLCANEITKKNQMTTITQFITKAKTVHTNILYDYSKVKYAGSHVLVTIICPIHGEFQQTPADHLSGHNCKLCSKQIISDKKTCTNDDFIKKAESIFSNQNYDYVKVNYISYNTHVIIICQIHGEFKQTPTRHLQGFGCPSCQTKIVLNDSLENNTKKFLEKAKQIHNDIYDYTKVDYINSNNKIIIICKIHGEFEQTPKSHTEGRGCAVCGREKQTKTTEQFIENSMKVHNGKYDYTKSVYTRADDKILITCPEHGDFYQIATEHENKGHGCSKCGELSRVTLEEYITRAQKIHGDTYDYTDVKYIGMEHNIDIICKIHGSFSKKADYHLKGYGCSLCSKCPLCQLWFTRGALCLYCQPKEKNKKYQKTKEYAVLKYLQEQIPNTEFIHNKSVGIDCTGGHLFPDIRFDCIFYYLIVEIDENKHRGANYDCDKQRMYDIIAKLGLPCIFIRYNPDSKNNKEETQKSLLKCINNYLKTDKENIVWNDFGFYVEYLFY